MSGESTSYLSCYRGWRETEGDRERERESPTDDLCTFVTPLFPISRPVGSKPGGTDLPLCARERERERETSHKQNCRV